MHLPDDRMPEAEVALRLAEFLAKRPGFGGHIDVAIDGASVRVGGADIFDITGYLAMKGWTITRQTEASRNAWAATYRRGAATMLIHSRSGMGDVTATIGGRRIIAECKKGPLIKRPGSPEYPLLTTAIGQALLFPSGPGDIVAAAVPDTPTFQRIAADWRERPRLKAAGIQIALVTRSGGVNGLNLVSPE